MTDTPTTPDTPANVVAALARVQAEVGGIEKKRGGEGGINYAFRGIDAIAAAAQPLLGRHGVVIVPELREQRIEQITVNNKPWSDTFVEVQWTVYGPGGVDDKIVAYTSGWGRDNADKGINKAMTGAFKNLLLRILCIGDPQDDTDGHTHERDDTRAPAARDSVADEVHALYARVAATAGTSKADTLNELSAKHDRKLTEAAFASDPDWREAVRVVLDAVDAEVPAGVDADTGEVLNPGIGALIDVLDDLDMDSELAETLKQRADEVGKGLDRDSLVADPEWAQEVAAIILESQS